LKCRALCKNWHDRIAIQPRVSALIQKHKKIFDLLNYDREVYDEFYYTRIIMKNTFDEIKHDYDKFEIPRIEMMRSDLDENELISYITVFDVPVDIKIFFYEFFQNINIIISLYPANEIKKIIMKQSDFLRNILYKGNESMRFTVLFTPFCWSKHVKNNIRDSNYFNVLCYCNVVDLEIESEFPDSDERYIIWQMDIAEMLEPFLMNKTIEIQKNKLINFISQLSCIDQCIYTLLNDNASAFAL
jgi:hypothetical protein